MVLGLITSTLVLYEHYNANNRITQPIYILAIVMLVFAIIDLLTTFMEGKLFVWNQVMSLLILAAMVWYTIEIINAYDDNTPVNDTLVVLSWVVIGLVIIRMIALGAFIMMNGKKLMNMMKPSKRRRR